MGRDEIAAREKRGNFPGPTGREMTEERIRNGESADGRAGGTGERLSREEERLPKKTAGDHMGDKKR